jgi:hypothetical protein
MVAPLYTVVALLLVKLPLVITDWACSRGAATAETMMAARAAEERQRAEDFGTGKLLQHNSWGARSSAADGGINTMG